MNDEMPDNEEPKKDNPANADWAPTQQMAYGLQKAQQKAALATMGRRIYELRLKKRWSQADLARASGLLRNVINTAERGLSLPRIENLRNIADALGVEISDLTDAPVQNRTLGQASPTVSIVELPGSPGIMWLSVNRPVYTRTAAKVLGLLDLDDAEDQYDRPVDRGGSR